MQTALTFGRSILGYPEAALRREWLVSNGIGGYAMGSVQANTPTRKYHGYLVAALEPPLGRVALVGGLSCFARYADAEYELSGFEWADGTFSDGYRHIDSWSLHDGIPTATFALAEAQVVQRVWMEYGSNTTYVQFEHVRGSAPIELRMRPLLTERDHHETSVDADWQPTIGVVPNGATVALQQHAATLRLLSDYAVWTTNGSEWIDAVHYRVETYRGYPDTARLLVAGEFYVTLRPGGSVTLVFSTEAAPDLDGHAALERASARASELLAQAALPADAPQLARQLVLAADQFIVRRDVRMPDGSSSAGVSVLAGYPWFSDWGRDTMIALPGLLLSTGRVELAARTLRTWSHFVSQGMLPNRFPDIGDEPEYNTVDATLWFVQALRATYQASGDRSLIADLYPVLQSIIAWHRQGTRYSIKVADDGLLAAGEPDVQLTWMDVKYKGWVVTPRQGKAIEINALWYSALRTLAEFAELLERPQDAAAFSAEAEQVQQASERFWSAEHGYLYDVLDGPDGADATLRPNQLLALALAHPLISGARAQAVVDVCARQLLIATGLRSLAPSDPAYIGRYGGDLKARDSAYHQGTAWAWLSGPFISAYARVYGAAAAQQWLAPFSDHLADGGVGSVSEIFDGDAPWPPRGCPWQAWSVAEWLRVWRELHSLTHAPAR